MNTALKKVKTTFIDMAQKDVEAFIAKGDFSEFDKVVIAQKSLGTNNQSIMALMNCTKEELFESFERIAKSLE